MTLHLKSGMLDPKLYLLNLCLIRDEGVILLFLADNRLFLIAALFNRENCEKKHTSNFKKKQRHFPQNYSERGFKGTDMF